MKNNLYNYLNRVKDLSHEERMRSLAQTFGQSWYIETQDVFDVFVEMVLPKIQAEIQDEYKYFSMWRYKNTLFLEGYQKEAFCIFGIELVHRKGVQNIVNISFDTGEHLLIFANHIPKLDVILNQVAEEIREYGLPNCDIRSVSVGHTYPSVYQELEKNS